MISLTLQELSRASGISASHLGRIEKGNRFPSARILQKIAKPLGFEEGDLFTLAGFLSPQPSVVVERPSYGQLHPYVAELLSQEPVETQHAVIAIYNILKRFAREYQFNLDFTEYARRRYPELDEDVITMIEDLIKRGTK